ncbi:ABC transporter permease [Alterisphingorhabdus coralli]|uniref:ABC transporter permease n=1 Tax=Alterisphingorhabdus coralli TaxID=3071408 RepID=A0AA97I076_9SPHN|nr:ABC transporter permease [Parasphingorhabdus sp. SCSIO 66989]WOE75469.1 ABC transporter permease [Parasphingorhabdus sp. SCSIO 66989]
MNETIRAAWVIARRDFAAIVFSKAFFFFLLGPLFPVALGLAAGGLTQQVARDIDQPTAALLMADEDAAAIAEAHATLTEQLGERRLPALERIAPDGSGEAQIAALLNRGEGDDKSLDAVLSGDLSKPVLTAPAAFAERWEGQLALLMDYARSGKVATGPPLTQNIVTDSSGLQQQRQRLTAQLAQGLLFLLTMLLAGMVLSNLVEEKTNKIIEILAAAIPIDSIFLGKLFAMLAMALIGIAVWMVFVIGGITLFGDGLPQLPTPAVGWPLFIMLGFVYFAMAYLLLGSLFLGIGALATTVREVQTLSMPVTMAQVLVFFLAAYSVPRTGEWIEWSAVLFPLSSPFAMLARAAQQGDVLQHILALGWQIGWALLIIRFGAGIFRRNVMKSGPATTKTGFLAAFGRG